MFKGGYQGVDFTGYTLSETPVTIPGLYNLLTTCGKPIIVSGLEGIMPTFIAGPVTSSDSVILPVVNLVNQYGVTQEQIVVTDKDAVSLVESVYPNE